MKRLLNFMRWRTDYRRNRYGNDSLLLKAKRALRRADADPGWGGTIATDSVTLSKAPIRSIQLCANHQNQWRAAGGGALDPPRN